MGNKSKKSRVQDERHEISSSVSISFFFAFVLELEGQTKKKPFKDGCILSGLFSSVLSGKQPTFTNFCLPPPPSLAFQENRNLRSPGIRAASTDFVSQNRPNSSFFLSVKSGRKAKKFEIVKVCLSGQKKA